MTDSSWTYRVEIMFEEEKDYDGYFVDSLFMKKIQEIGKHLDHPRKLSFDERRDMAHIIWLMLEQAEPLRIGDQI